MSLAPPDGRPPRSARGVLIAAFVGLWRGAEPQAPALSAVAPTSPDGGAYREMLELIGDPILLVRGATREDSSSRRLLFANAAARTLLHIQRPEGLLTTAIRAPEVLEAIDEALYGRRRAEAVYELVGAPDRFWRVQALPLDGPEENLAVLWLRDETEQRRSERTRADFLANASHELRTPLASVAGFIETLRGHAKDDAGAREAFLPIMAAQAERMRRLIDDLMSLSRIELNEHIAPTGVADLSLLVVEVLDGLAPLAGERGVILEPPAPSPPTPIGEALIAAERDQVVQVIQNLVENALKYSPRGARVRVEVAADLSLAEISAALSPLAARFALLVPSRPNGARYVAVRVRDQGPGIARNHLPRLTERFYRAEDGKPRERPGTGLGLAIVKHIVSRHRGGLTVESTPGEGSLFCAYFPAAQPETPNS